MRLLKELVWEKPVLVVPLLMVPVLQAMHCHVAEGLGTILDSDAPLMRNGNKSESVGRASAIFRRIHEDAGSLYASLLRA